METRSLVCTECPRGCDLIVTLDKTGVIEVKGNFCAKGRIYAQNECTRPLRVVTSTVRMQSGEMLPVKTDRGVLKSDIFKTIANINKVTARRPVRIGQELAENIDGNGARVLAAKDID
jgi:CxxC motif-containing protein